MWATPFFADCCIPSQSGSSLSNVILQWGRLTPSHDGAGLQGGQTAPRHHPLQLATCKGDAIWGGGEVEQA